MGGEAKRGTKGVSKKRKRSGGERNIKEEGDVMI